MTKEEAYKKVMELEAKNARLKAEIARLHRVIGYISKGLDKILVGTSKPPLAEEHYGREGCAKKD